MSGHENRELEYWPKTQVDLGFIPETVQLEQGVGGRARGDQARPCLLAETRAR